MNTSKKGLLARILSGVVAFCLALCGFAATVLADAANNYVGTWDAQKIVEGDEVVEGEMLDMLATIGESCSLTIAEEGTFTLNMLGQVAEGTWKEATDGIELTAEGDTIKVAITDGVLKLVLSDDESYPFYIELVKADDGIVGSWKAVSMTDNGETIGSDMLAMLETLGTTITLEFKDDGTFVINSFDMATMGTWEQTEAGLKLTAEGDAIEATLADGIMTLDLSTEEYSLVVELAKFKAEKLEGMVGIWDASGIVEGEEEIAVEDLMLMKAFGMATNLVFTDDGNVTFCLLGAEMGGTWTEDKDKGTVSFVFTDPENGDTYEMTCDVATPKAEGAKDAEPAEAEVTVPTMVIDFSAFAGEKLVITFEKASNDPEAANIDLAALLDGIDTAALTGGNSDVAITPALTGALIADDELCTIEVVDKSVDWAGDPGYTIRFTNNSDKVLELTCEWDSFSVGPKMVEPSYLSLVAKPGKYAEDFMYFDSEELGGGLEALVDVEGVLEVYDYDSYEVVARYEFVA